MRSPYFCLPLAAAMLFVQAAVAQERFDPKDPSCVAAPRGAVSAMQVLCGFAGERALFKINDRWGYLDRQGQVSIAPDFLGARSFGEGLAPAFDEKQKLWGYIDNRGKWVIAPQYGAAGAFHQGLARVRTVIEKPPKDRDEENCGCDDDDRWEWGKTIYINREGKQAFATALESGGDFYGDHALVSVGEAGMSHLSYQSDQAFIDRTGKITALPKPPDWLPANTRVYVTDKARRAPERWLAELRLPEQVLSASGRVLPLTAMQVFEHAATPHVAVVRQRASNGDYYGGKTGLMDETGRWLVSPRYRNIQKFKRGVAEARLESKQMVLISDQGKPLTKPYARIDEKDGFFLGLPGTRQEPDEPDDKGAKDLLGPRGERLAQFKCGGSGYNTFSTWDGVDKDWTVAGSCDGRYWVKSPANRVWSGKGKVESARMAQNYVLLRFEKTRQVYDRQGKALLTSAMQKQLGAVENAWLTVDEINPPEKAIRPLAVFASENGQVHVLTPAGQLVRVSDASTAGLDWREARDGAVGSPVLLSSVTDRYAIGSITAEGRWLAPQQGERRRYRHNNGWIEIRQPDDDSASVQYMNARGQTVAIEDEGEERDIAPGITWRQQKNGDWLLLDANKGELRPMPELQGLRVFNLAHGRVVVAKYQESANAPDSDEDRPRKYQLAIFSTEGQRLSPWLWLDQLNAVAAAETANPASLLGWIGSRSSDAAGRYSLLLSADGKALTPLAPMTMETGGNSLIRFTTGQGEGVMNLQGQTLIPAVHKYISTGDFGWLKTADDTRFDGLLDGQGNWLAVLPEDRSFAALQSQNVVNLRPSYRAWVAVDINGRRAGLQPAPTQPLAAPDLTPEVWVTTPSPLPPAAQSAVDDSQPANWFVHEDDYKHASVRDMNGAAHLSIKAGADDVSIFGASVAYNAKDGHRRLLNFKGETLAELAGGLLPLGANRLAAQQEQPLPPDHPLARPAFAAAVENAYGERDLLTRNSAPAGKQFGLVRETDGRILVEPGFDLITPFSEERATISRMGNLGLIDTAGHVLLQSAWRCGETPVLLDAQNEIIWPAELRGQAKQACPQP